MTGEPTRLRATVIGAGGISREHLKFLASSDRCELVGVCDLSHAAAGHAAGEFGTDAYTSVGEMLEAARPDVVHVLTPPATHVALARDALAAGCHVICEKPVTLDAVTLEELLAAASHAGRRLVENHNYRFNPEIAALDDLVAAGALGQV